MAITQLNRHARLITPLGEDTLLFWRMVADEGVSQLFDYELMVLSEDEHIDLDKLVGCHAHVEMELPDEGMRYFCGHVTRFSFMGFRGNLARYQLRLRPWLWFLTRTMDCRIFQNLSVPDIIREVCREHGFTDIDDRMSASYKPREFCVQYRESDFDFISRLMEDEGIYYYFIHTEGKHELVLADSISAHEPYEGYEFVPWHHPDQADNVDRDHLDAWQASRAVRSGKFALRDYNFTTPKANLEVKSRMARDIEHGEYEMYDYPGHYQEVEDGETYARLRMEAAQSDFEVLSGSGNAKGLIPGHLFELENYPRDELNREYLILSVSHDITQNTYDTEASDPDTRFEYSCALKAMRSSEIFRPSLATRRPKVYGPQTAVVVGEKGEDIWTDEHGRIKVQFHWDREGNLNENSSCWVRVSQAWAGKKWGAQFLPRIGHEVIVEFLEGDPDRPIVTGSVYNADNKPPYDLPANATQSGIKSRSSKNGTASNYNEIRFEDKKGAERLDIHAEKDMHTRVEHCQTSTVDVDRSVTVGNDEKLHVKNDREKNVDSKETTVIGLDRSVSIGNEETLTVGANRSQTIGINDSLDVGVNRSANVGVSDSVNAGATIDLTAGGVINLTAGGAINLKAGGLITMMSPPGVVITHNAVTDTGLLRSVVEQAKNEVVTTFDEAKSLSTSLSGLSLSYTGVGISHTSVKMDIPSVIDINKNAKAKIEKSDFSIEELKAIKLMRFSVFLAG